MVTKEHIQGLLNASEAISSKRWAENYSPVDSLVSMVRDASAQDAADTRLEEAVNQYIIENPLSE